MLELEVVSVKMSEPSWIINNCCGMIKKTLQPTQKLISFIHSDYECYNMGPGIPLFPSAVAKGLRQ